MERRENRDGTHLKIHVHRLTATDRQGSYHARVHILLASAYSASYLFTFTNGPGLQRQRISDNKSQYPG